MAFIRKNKGMLMCILKTKLMSYCIIFETNIFTEMVIYTTVDCKSDIRQGSKSL